MHMITTKDFQDYTIRTEAASQSIKQGRLKLMVVTNPLEGTVRYEIVLGDKTSRSIRKFSYAVDVYNNIMDHIGEDGSFDQIDSMILSANRFA